MDPLLQQMIDAGLVDDRADVLAQQIRRGQGLMQTPGAQGMQVGGTYRAASPFEHLATALSRAMGGRMVKGAEQEYAQGIETKRQAVAGQMAAQNAPAPQSWGLPEGLTRAEGVKLLRPNEQPRPTDPLLEEKRAQIVAETERLRRPEQRPASFPVIVGAGGEQYRIDPRNPNAPAVPVLDPTGKPVLKPQGGAHGAGMADVVERKRVMLSDGQLKTIAEYDRFRDALRDIATRKAQIDTGPVASRRNAAAAKVGADDPQVSAFRASVGDSLSSYIKGLSGAAVSDRERAFLIQNVPKMEDNDAVFSAKLQTVLDRLDRLRAMEIDLFSKQGKDVSSFTGAAPDLTGEAAAIERRGHGAGHSAAPEQPRRRRYNPQTGALE